MGTTVGATVAVVGAAREQTQRRAEQPQFLAGAEEIIGDTINFHPVLVEAVEVA
jgi:hypothetical protein